MYKTILVPTDGSECSNNAITHALEVAKVLNATVVFLYVIPTLLPSVRPGRDYVEQVIHDIKQAGNEILKAACQKAEAKAVSCSSSMVEFARPVDAITSVAGDYDLIVMGSHGRGNLERILIGSVTDGVIKRSQKPVMVVPCLKNISPT